MKGAITAVLFDLDGTLVDSAPDLVDALNRLCLEQGRAVVAPARVRPAVSKGGRAILACGFPDVDSAGLDALLPRYLEIYIETGFARSVLFPGMAEALAEIEQRGIRWGIVTNKPGWLTRPLLDVLGITERCSALVCGDTLPVKKPDPQPVLHALAIIGAAPAHTLFVGDDPRDIQAGAAAGTGTVVAAYGYIDDSVEIGQWGADHVIVQALDLLDLLTPA